MNLFSLTDRNSTNQKFNGRALLLAAWVLTAFALTPAARAVNPPPDGGYVNNNTAEGTDALFSLTTGDGNTAIGSLALHDNVVGNANTATGARALFRNVASDNTANGFAALFSNFTGSDNTATGGEALEINKTGNLNTANGFRALRDNIAGSDNTATGGEALESSTTGNLNTANGFRALHDNIAGSNNTANGVRALESNTTGNENAANGDSALHDNKTGDGNTACGAVALFHNTTGNENIALGGGAGSNLTTGDNNIDIGNQGATAEANTIRIGTQGLQNATFIAGIIGVPPVAGPTVHISGTGQLGIGPPSSQRFKDAIKPMDSASEAILALKPVTFRYKKELDPEGTPQFGLVAEDVEKVNPALVDRDAGGKPYTVRYDAVNAMLLNEFLKEHQKVQRLEAALAAVNERLKAQDAKIDKVDAKVELTKPAPQTVLNSQ